MYSASTPTSTVMISREYSQFSYPWLQQNHTIPHVEIEIDKNGKLTDFKKNIFAW